MRENSNLYTSYRSGLIKIIWFLVGTLCSLTVSAQSSEIQNLPSQRITKTSDLRYQYDSSIQRSNFLALNPRYLDRIDAETVDRRSQFFWKLRFDAQAISTDDNINSQIAGANFVGKFNYKFLQGLRFKAKANLNLESGRAQEIFGDQENGSGVYPREVLVEFEPLKDNVIIQGGLIQQRFFNNSLFVARLPFLGLSERVGIKGKRYDLYVRAQQLVPTSYTLGTRVTERENVPYFYTESLEGMLHTSQYNFIKGRVTHFRYVDLPSIVAFNSFIGGNTVTNTDVNNAQFIYGFEGWTTQLGVEQKISDGLSAQVIWDTIVNNEAPSNAGESQNITGILAYDTGRWIVAGHYSTFFIESDAVPAAYNSHIFGSNNREGQSISLRLESKDWGVQFLGQFVDADLLNQSTRRIDGLQQDNQQTIYFAVETMYDFL